MTEKTINCAECNVEFTFEENPKYPRKYCLSCSAKKKKQYAEKDEKYAEPHTEGYGAPVEKVPYTVEHEGSPPVKSKEYHLSPEQVRSNALDLALKYEANLDVPKLLSVAGTFEKWINDN